METVLTPLHFDERIIQFISQLQQPEEFCPNVDPTYVVGLAVCGFVYRLVYCYSREELDKLTFFLTEELGEFEQVLPNFGLYRMFSVLETDLRKIVTSKQSLHGLRHY